MYYFIKYTGLQYRLLYDKSDYNMPTETLELHGEIQLAIL